MNIITLDFETFYSDDYTLSKMTTESYIRDPRFEAHGVAIAAQGEKAYWVPREHIAGHLQQFDWPKLGCLCHHAQFDGLILSHHYGVKPRVWFDTLGMARLMLGNHLSVGLDSLARHYGLSAKTVPYNLFRGRHWSELDPSIQRQVADGAIHDVELTWQLFNILGKDFPREEYEVLDSLIRMFTEPALVGDIDILGKIWADEDIRKKTNLEMLNVTAADLASADRFAQLLRDEGIEPEMKDGKKKKIYAFAKTDQFMRDLLESNNDRIRTLAEARLGEKSTIMQTRAETFGWMARRGPLPVYLNYAGAGTLRPSGGDSSNFLNLKRRSPIRPALMAPKGYLLGPVDASQIECRCLHFLAGGTDEPVVQKFRNHEDPYIDLASQFYGEKIYKPKKGDPREAEMEAKRGMGKQGRLMCGYGAAGKQFRATAKNGQYGPPVDIPIDDAIKFVSMYRTTTPSVCAPRVGYWSICNFKMLPALANGSTLEVGPLTIKDHRIYLPNGAMMIYDTLEWHIPDADEECRDFERAGFWRLKTRQGWKKMWGAKLTQNICEAVSRVIVSQAMLRIKRAGFRTLNWPYDELCLLIPDDGHAEENLQLCMNEMKRTPDWLPGIPLDCEGSLGERYSK